ncbi:ABC transporter permease [Aliarcobacter trophiarum LMG 25534]|uniref:ABC transporter permease n=1 Tax=Aliarcobacter trophiarum LMG 25534 TaxID=1032241 RepID=A0AAD0VLG6_9BACT|nr:ABC transporter permease [Aliarcobacter trophiarum]AXK47971.1 lipid asymmetry ABC transporter MlaABCDEF, permease component MlaE [Aliarcobacter trophiarum LMG 25534]RXI26067.1 ABC transporter permease [Aliarcobacter trophiarum]RXJ89315.1 ABC transporter permease [Aliarcobacter trophiarum LMG 25534]
MKSIRYFILEKQEDKYNLTLLNIWNKNSMPNIIEEMKNLDFHSNKNISLDFENLKELDSIAIIYLISFLKKFKKQNISYLNFEKYEQIFEFYQKHYQDKSFENKKVLNKFFESVGKKTYEILKSTKLFIDFVGKVFYFLIYLIFNPKKVRVKATLKYIETSAVDALLIVGVTAFLVGVVIAYQGAVQLEKFGANIFVVEMISITMFREIAPLVTAIVIAGRSASSYTAEIGAMKITEEIDAMRTMNFEPIIFLTLPRIFALCISLPLLVFFADIIGVMGGMLIAFTSLDVTYIEFINRLQNEVPLKHLLLGVFKAIFFGFFIAIIGCFRGFQVQNNTTSIGKYTTISVVNAIFVVILLDAVFSVIFTKMGI